MLPVQRPLLTRERSVSAHERSLPTHERSRPAYERSLLGCIQLLSRADTLRSKPAPLDDALRQRCITEGVAYYRGLGLTKKKDQSWEACAASSAAADSLEGKAKEGDPDWVDCETHPDPPKKGPH